MYKQLEKVRQLLEKHYRDMQDMEFTVEEGTLYMLQTRVGKRTPAATFEIAVDMAKEGLISKEEAIERIKPEDIDRLFIQLSTRRQQGRILPSGKWPPELTQCPGPRWARLCSARKRPKPWSTAEKK